MFTNDSFRTFLAGLAGFFGGVLVLIPLTVLLVSWRHERPPTDTPLPHGGAYVLAGEMCIGIMCSIAVSIGVGIWAAYRVSRNHGTPPAD